MQTARVAVVIPAYNSAATLPRAVESVLAAVDYATRTAALDLRTEIVVVDDGSTDDTQAVFEALAARLAARPEILFKPLAPGGNRGAGPARNAGVRHATAPLIAFLDADDEYLPSHLAVCIAALNTDRDLGYVWTRRRLGAPVHPSWMASLDQSSVVNLCIRRVWHEIAKGFPEHPDFRDHGMEDTFYRIILRNLVTGRGLPEETVMVHARPGNSIDRQIDKKTTPMGEWDSRTEADPPPAIVAALQDRLDYIERLRGEMSG